ncbi:hypothetical protein CFC21_026919 [Triticum aestivum]|uniref:C2H2-type domain-containing protein n=2 Tax=Triticum aestivum TaxID=4565 RepID=A0A3B6CHM0_WHEAT|nr:uncharacterized protein LOC123047569 [Triticum aestivum]KAF7012760.1 hypothetical protein CFC21_026919 [Triticum aestivum]
MVEPNRSAGSKSSTTTTTVRKKKLAATSPATPKPDKEKLPDGGKKHQSSHGSSATAAAADSPSYRLALRSLFSCRNSHAAQHQHNQRAAPPQPAPAPADDASSRRCKKKSKKQTQLGCSASICKLRDASPRRVTLHRPPAEEEPPSGAATGAGEPCKRRASVSGGGERRVKKPLQQPQHGQGNEAAAAGAVVVGSSSRHWGSSTASSSSSTAGGGGGSSFRLRRLSGCYECHMVVDPAGGGSSMRAAIFPCPDCGDVFVRAESLHLHQSTRHAVSELGPEDTSRNIIEIIFQSSWLKKQTPVCAVDRILKVHNAPATLARFEAYRDAVKARARGGRPGAGRCTADGNELLRFHCAALACSLGAGGATHLCDAAGSSCAACGIVRDGFKFRAPGVRTMATSGRAHDDAVGGEEGEGGGERRRAMLVCRVIAGRVKRRCEGTADKEEAEASPSAEEEAEEEYDSVAGTAGVYSSLDELEVFNPTAILPCFVVVYKA